jgi:hypothetical protein
MASSKFQGTNALVRSTVGPACGSPNTIPNPHTAMLTEGA